LVDLLELLYLFYNVQIIYITVQQKLFPYVLTL